MRFVSFVAACVLALGMAVGAARAATIDYKTYISGTDLGTSSIATLEASQVGSDVLFTLTNTLAGPANSFLSKLYLTFTGSRPPVSRVDVSGVASSAFFKGPTIDGLAYQLQLSWHGADRLNPGESSTFRLLNVSLSELFQGTDFSRVQMRQPGGVSSSYMGSVASVPLPAAGLLLLAALGGLGLMRRRKAA